MAIVHKMSDCKEIDFASMITPWTFAKINEFAASRLAFVRIKDHKTLQLFATKFALPTIEAAVRDLVNASAESEKIVNEKPATWEAMEGVKEFALTNVEKESDE